MSAALGLVATHEDFVASTKADLAKIPHLEKQAKTLREQMVQISGLLGAAELRIAELRAELSETTKRATDVKDDLTKKKEAFEKVAARVPGLESEISSLTEHLNESKELAAARERMNVAKDSEIASLQAQILKDKAQSDKAIALRDTRIGELKHALVESGERGLMLAEAERFERIERVPALRIEISNLETEAERRDAEMKAQSEDLEDTRYQLQLVKRRGDTLQQSLNETRVDLAKALEPPKVRSHGIQVQASTKEFGDTFLWSHHDKPKKGENIIAVSSSIAAFCDLPADHPQVVRQQTASCGAHAHVQATVDMCDQSDHCVLKTIREEELEQELEECEDALEQCEVNLASTKQELESTKVKLRLAQMDCENSAEERDDALALVEEIEDKTSERLNSQWSAKFRVQAM